MLLDRIRIIKLQILTFSVQLGLLFAHLKKIVHEILHKLFAWNAKMSELQNCRILTRKTARIAEQTDLRYAYCTCIRFITVRSVLCECNEAHDRLWPLKRLIIWLLYPVYTIEQKSNRRRTISTCILNTFARWLLDVCSIVKRRIIVGVCRTYVR